MSDKHTARISISTDLLLQALAFPEDTEIMACIGDRAYLGIIDIIVESADLPTVEPGNPIPLLTPTLTADYDKRPATWIKFNWNLPSDKAAQ